VTGWTVAAILYACGWPAMWTLTEMAAELKAVNQGVEREPGLHLGSMALWPLLSVVGVFGMVKLLREGWREAAR